MKQQQIEAVARSSARPEQVWALLADVTTWTEWGLHDEATLTRTGSPDPAGVGAQRRFRLGRYVSIEDVVAFEPPRHLAYVLVSGLPVRGYRADVTLTPHDEGTVLTWRSTFTPKVPGTGGAIRHKLGRFIQETADRVAAAATAPVAPG